MDNTELLALPYIMPAQAQKHVTHNEALRSLDALVHLSLKSRSVAEPPADPEAGDRYAIATGATGSWSGRDGKIAAWQDGAWAYSTPRDGWVAWCEDEAVLLVRADAAWATLASPNGLQDLPLLGVNAEADVDNRLVVASPASLFNHEGTDHRLKVNRASGADTASVLLQTGFAGNAELGLVGDDLALKVSADGSSWLDAMSVDTATGSIHMPHTPTIANVSSVRFTDQFETNSSSYVDVTGFSVTVSPRSATSRFLIFVGVCGYHKDNFSGFVRLRRNTTEILSGVAASLPSASVAFLDLGTTQSWTIPTRVNFGIDAPATTSPVTYSIQVKSGSTGEPVYLNRNHQTTYTSGYLPIQPSTMIVMEISA